MIFLPAHAETHAVGLLARRKPETLPARALMVKQNIRLNSRIEAFASPERRRLATARCFAKMPRIKGLFFSSFALPRRLGAGT